MLGAEGLVKAREVLARPKQEWRLGQVVVPDELGDWEPHAMASETWTLGTQRLEIYY